MLRKFHTYLFIGLLLLLASANAQVHIGDGVTISKGTSFIIKNMDVNLATEEIKGEGALIIINDNEQNILVNQRFNTKNNLQITAVSTKVRGKFSNHFELQHLPPLTNEIIAAKKVNVQQKLPVRYINFEGKVYDSEPEKTPVSVYNRLPDDTPHGFVIAEILQSSAVNFHNYYIIPIYSFTLNDERFSDYAELYKFESLTAIFKPPIV